MKRVTHKHDIDETLRMLVIERPGFNVKTQRDALASVGRGVEYTDLEGWLRSIRPGDRAALAWLHLLAPPPGKEMKPLAAFNRLYDRLMAARAVVIEAGTGKTSDGKDWPDAVAKARDVIRSGRHMTRREAKRRGEKGRKARPLSTAERWASEPALFRTAQATWASRKYRNDAAAWSAVNELLEGLGRAGMQFGSKETARRVLGNRAK